MNKNYWKKKAILFSLLIFIIFTCSALAKEPQTFPQLTSLEAAALAYQEALKWDPEAVLWYVNPHGRKLDFDWVENDRSWEWDIIFVCPKDDKRYNIKIVNDGIVSMQEEKHVKRISSILPAFPVDRPGISMKEAAWVSFDAGAPSGERPTAVYIIDNAESRYRGKPVWNFLFASQSASYTIDGLSGELLEIRFFDPISGKEITPEEAQHKIISEMELKIEEENFIYHFFEAIDQRNYDSVFSMMAENLSGNNNMQEMWKTSFSSLEHIKVIWLYPEKEEQGNQHLYRVTIYAIIKQGCTYSGWDEGENTRWITIESKDNKWKIASIATGR